MELEIAVNDGYRISSNTSRGDINFGPFPDEIFLICENISFDSNYYS